MPTEKKQFHSIRSLLHNNSEILSALCYRASQISRLQKKLCLKLDPVLSAHLLVANFNSDALTIHTDSPAWAARLRFKIPDILDIAKETCGLRDLHSVRVKVVIPVRDSSCATKAMSLSDETVQMMLKTADSITNDNLRRALIRLSKHSQ